MRKGFTLVEILVIIVVLPFVLVVLDGLFRTLLHDIPWSWRLVQQNTTVLNMLEQLQQDTDKAKGLPKSFAGRTASDELLLIELTDGVVCYQLKDGRVIRRKLTDTRDSSEPDSETTFRQTLRRSLRRTYAGYAEQERVWSLPNTKIQWQVWARNGKGYAVQAETYSEQKVRGQWKKKMARSHLYFVGAL